MTEPESMSKHVQIGGDWIFEVKMVRALKVAEYGQPYSAIANCNINGDAMYIDGLLTQEGQNFTRNDFKIFNNFCYQMGGLSNAHIIDIKMVSQEPKTS